jgi:hypothetical protein
MFQAGDITSMRFKPSDAREILDLLVGVREIRDENTNKKPLDAIAILSLPEHLRKTALTVHKMGRATAVMIAEATGSKVDVEKSNLFELRGMGYLEMEKQDEDIFFTS